MYRWYISVCGGDSTLPSLLVCGRALIYKHYLYTVTDPCNVPCIQTSRWSISMLPSTLLMVAGRCCVEGSVMLAATLCSADGHYWSVRSGEMKRAFSLIPRWLCDGKWWALIILDIQTASLPSASLMEESRDSRPFGGDLMIPRQMMEQMRPFVVGIVFQDNVLTTKNCGQRNVGRGKGWRSGAWWNEKHGPSLMQ